MRKRTEKEIILGEIEEYHLRHPQEPVIITYYEGDSYRCLFMSDYLDCNDEEIDSLAFEEWLSLLYTVQEVLVPGPNEYEKCGHVEISGKLMPYKIQCGNTVLFEDGKLLIN